VIKSPNIDLANGVPKIIIQLYQFVMENGLRNRRDGVKFFDEYPRGLTLGEGHYRAKGLSLETLSRWNKRLPRGSTLASTHARRS
jgi:hypothetical protein